MKKIHENIQNNDNKFIDLFATTFSIISFITSLVIFVDFFV